MSPMHVVVASHQQLPGKGSGGPQGVVVALVRGLAALGHRITLLAPPGSRVTEATLVEVPARKFGDPAELARYVPDDAELLHSHSALTPAPPALPFIQTFHHNLKPGSPLHPNTVFLSRDHARRHGSEVFVYNGLDPAEYFFRRFPKRAEQFDLFLGKLHSAKGYHWAVEAAKHTGHRLVPAAQTIHTRSPQACRALAERQFTHLVMAQEYVRMYRCLLDTGKLPPGRPTAAA